MITLQCDFHLQNSVKSEGTTRAVDIGISSFKTQVVCLQSNAQIVSVFLMKMCACPAEFHVAHKSPLVPVEN